MKILALHQQNRRGISLLELMITIVLLSTVLIAFAAVVSSRVRVARMHRRAAKRPAVGIKS